jgi:hypothetical protein
MNGAGFHGLLQTVENESEDRSIRQIIRGGLRRKAGGGVHGIDTFIIALDRISYAMLSIF